MHVRNQGYSSGYQPTDISDLIQFMFKLYRYGKFEGTFERYAGTLRIIIRGIDEKRMIVSGQLYSQYVRVLHDVEEFMKLYNKHEGYINDFIVMYEGRGEVLYEREGSELFEKYLGGMAFVHLDDIMETLSLM